MVKLFTVSGKYPFTADTAMAMGLEVLFVHSMVSPGLTGPMLVTVAALTLKVAIAFPGLGNGFGAMFSLL